MIRLALRKYGISEMNKKLEKSSSNDRYMSRINLVLDYIENNIENAFMLEELANISGFSPCHFSRVFSGVMKETLFGYITRLKLERVKGWLLVSPRKSITDIALDYGFNDSSELARAFKKEYGISASRYRKLRNKSKDYTRASPYNGEKKDIRSEVMSLDYAVDKVKKPEKTVMYLRHVGTYEEFAKQFQPMICKLVAYAQQNNLADDNTELLAVYHDNPEITKDENRRISMCLTVPQQSKITDEFGQMMLPAGEYAVGHFSLDNGEQRAEAWQRMFGEWLPNSGYQPDDRQVFEVYLNDSNMHPEKKHLIDIYLPIKSL